MTQLKITAIILLSILALLLCTVLGLSLAHGGAAFSPWISAPQDYSLVQEKRIPAKDISGLEINYSMNSNDVFFYPGDGEDILIREYMNFTPEDRQLSTIEQAGGSLRIKGVRHNAFFFLSFGVRSAYTEIYLPEGFAQGLDRLSVKTVSGDISSQVSFTLRESFTASSTSGEIAFPAVTAKALQMTTTSGDIRMENIAADTLSISTTSGDISLNQVAGSAVLSSTSGDILMESVTMDTLSVSTTSGRIRLGQAEGTVKLSSTSGDISLGQVTGDMELNTTSGEIRLQDGVGNLDCESTSGGVQVGRLEGSFQLNTTSGEISLADGSGFGTAGTVSGDVRIFLTALQGDLSVSTTSGEVNLRLPKDASLALRFQSTSGECRTFFDDDLSFNKKGNKAEGSYNGGAHALSVSTVSGDLRIAEH